MEEQKQIIHRVSDLSAINTHLNKTIEYLQHISISKEQRGKIQLLLKNLTLLNTTEMKLLMNFDANFPSFRVSLDSTQDNLELQVLYKNHRVRRMYATNELAITIYGIIEGFSKTPILDLMFENCDASLIRDYIEKEHGNELHASEVFLISGAICEILLEIKEREVNKC